MTSPVSRLSWQFPFGARDVMHAVTTDERIVVCFGDLMAERGDVLGLRTRTTREETGGEPGRVVHDIALLNIAVAGRARFVIIGVEAEDAALPRVSLFSIAYRDVHSRLARLMGPLNDRRGRRCSDLDHSWPD